MTCDARHDEQVAREHGAARQQIRQLHEQAEELRARLQARPFVSVCLMSVFVARSTRLTTAMYDVSADVPFSIVETSLVWRRRREQRQSAGSYLQGGVRVGQPG